MPYIRFVERALELNLDQQVNRVFAICRFSVFVTSGKESVENQQNVYLLLRTRRLKNRSGIDEIATDPTSLRFYRCGHPQAQSPDPVRDFSAAGVGLLDLWG